MTDDTIPLFSFPAVQGKKITAAFDGGRMSSDGGVMLLSLAERRLGVAERLARCIPDRRDPMRIAHTIADLIRARVFAICCGCEDADDLDDLRSDPAFKLACGRLPDTGRDLCSQPTLSRLENAPGMKDAVLALDLKTGQIKWANRAMYYDTWNVSCIFVGAGGPDYDFGGSGPNMLRGNGLDLLGIGEKSGA